MMRWSSVHCDTTELCDNGSLDPGLGPVFDVCVLLTGLLRSWLLSLELVSAVLVPAHSRM